MSIQLPSAPAETMLAVQGHLTELFSQSGQAHGHLRTLDAAASGATDLSLTRPHRVYSATAQDILSGNVLGGAKEDTWQYFITRSDEAIATAEVRSHEGSTALSQVNEGPFVAGTLAAIATAENRLSHDQRDYEVRLLRIPSVYVVALWLHAKDADELVPIAPTPSCLEASHIYDEPAFTDALREFAEQRIAVSDGMA